MSELIAHSRRLAALAILAISMVTGCGRSLPSPLQSPAPVDTATAAPSNTPVKTNTPLPSPVPGATNTPGATNPPTATAGPNVTAVPVVIAQATPNIAATNAVVFAMLTAVAATPTRAPTQTPQPVRRAVTSGGVAESIDLQPQTAGHNGISLVSANAQAIRGGPLSVTLRTKPGANCSLRQVTSQGSTMPANGVPSQIAATDGGVAWIWTAPADAEPGRMIYEAFCGEAGNLRFYVQIVP